MKAGRELDAKIAKIMGWTQVQFDSDEYWNDYCGYENGEVEDPNSYWSVPYYSENIIDALEMVEKFDMYEVHKIYEHDYVCWIYTNGNAYEATAETLPLALCRCVLKVVEMEI